MDPLEIFISNRLTGNILSSETTCIKFLNGNFRNSAFSDSVFQIISILILNPVTTNMLCNFLLVSLKCNQLISGRDVNPINVGETNWWGCTCKVNLASSSITRHINNFTSSGSTYNRIIHQQNISSCKLTLDSVQLKANTLLSGFLPRHDKCSGNISVFDESLSKRSAEMVCSLQSTRPGGIRNRYDNINVVVRVLLHNLMSKLLSHDQTSLVYGNSIHDGVRTCKIHILENARCQGCIGMALSGMTIPLEINKDRLTGLDITDKLKSKCINGDRLARHAIIE
mmetsp:Transcript_26705/g.39547  ORF Transcript_26705/g.39547 Transcript_26705/m.39547 type:complete len:283 (-) Transcript_26705:751-1599(-)